MLKVLIVDDDSVARTSIKNLLDWNSHGYTICGEAKNGREALELVKAQAPDIVITDISMPIMGGIEFIECLEEEYPQIKKIVLSGFDNYEYIRKSMKNNATDYILKHIVDEKTMLEVLEEISKDLIKDEMLEKQIIESRTVLKQRFFNQLVSGTLNELDEIKEKIEALNIPLDTKDLIIVLFELDDFLMLQEKFTAKETEKLIASVEDICDEVLKSFEKSAACHLDGGKFLIMMSFRNTRSELFIYSMIASIVYRIKVSIKRYLNVTACFSYSTVFNDITETAKN
ncbi:MAG: response regulator, partial [Clostridiaceae bacterium]|nr:response regulator [Clostridiaceae bacterium]